MFSYPLGSSRLKKKIIVLVAIFGFCTPVFAQQSVLTNPAIKKNVYKKNNPAVNQFVDIKLESVEIVTRTNGTNLWQVNVKNNSNKSIKNFKIYVQALGFRAEDKSDIMTGNISSLQGNSSGFTRGPLPSFPGMHQLAVKVGGPYLKVQIPRPFRQDANGNPASALKIEKAWARKLDGKIRWYMKTKPNIYGTILPKKIQFMVSFRERKKKYCHQEAFKKIGYMDNQQLISYICPETHHASTNMKAIKTGASMTFSGELNNSTAKPHLPTRVDRLNIEFVSSGEKKYVPLPESLFAPYHKCTDE